jgi:hypothetical protein
MNVERKIRKWNGYEQREFRERRTKNLFGYTSKSHVSLNNGIIKS